MASDIDNQDKVPHEASPAAEKTLVTPVLREEVHVGKRWTDSGKGVRVEKHPRQAEHLIQQELVQETVTVKRVPVDKLVALDAAPSSRQEGDTLIIPVTEEVLIVEKRLRIKEELHITKNKHAELQSETVNLAWEEVRIEHFEETPQARPDTDSASTSRQNGSS